ncbi:MAG TPA: hypothetical protein VIL13_11100 [Longimicrobiales bacterium]
MAIDEPTAPASGSAEPEETDLTPETEPVLTGTLFFSMLLLLLIFGFWAMMYVTLLYR